MDPWKTLGLAPGASPEAVKQAYRSQALRWHPDRNGGSAEAAERFKAVAEAYRALRGGGPRRAPETAESARDLFQEMLDGLGLGRGSGGDPFRELFD